jgi:hypothetical protein
MSRRIASAFPTGESVHDRMVTSIVLALLVAAMLAVAIAPLLMPDSYSIVEHSISESAGQGVEGAWLARSGFLFVGSAVFLLVGIAGDLWGEWGRRALRFYAAATISAGVFAHGPWEDVPFDRLEGYLHTVAAFFAGAGFALGVLVIGSRRPPGADWRRGLDVLALIAVSVLPVTMLLFDDYTGIQQRFLALIGFVWLIAETMRVHVWSARADMSRARQMDGQTGDRSRAGPYTRSR